VTGNETSGASQERHQPLLVVLSGPSGAGKDSVLDELARRGHRFHRVITCTTRAPRPGERAGVDYFFVTDADFDALIESGGLLEHAVVYGHRSGVPRQQVVDKLAEGVDVYVRTDVQGAASIKRLMPESVLVFVAPASIEDLEARLRARATDGEEQVLRRLDTAQTEMDRRGEFEYVIVNAPGKLAATADQLAEILDAERMKPRQWAG
jgi:guanylate kinase